MKGASFARQGEASDLELVPTWVAVWVRFFDLNRKTTFCNKKSPKTEGVIVIRYYLALRGAENGVTVMVTPFFCVQG